MAAAAKSPDIDQRVGQEIRALRKNRNLTLVQLADKAGCSVGYLSEVERGARTVSVKFLRALSEGLSVPLGWFFTHEDQPAGEAGIIVRAQNRKRIGTGDDGLYEELLSPDINGAFEMFLTRIEPGTQSSGTIKRDVEEEGYILNGTLELTTQGTTFTLTQGDSFRVNASPFSWHNRGGEQVSIIWVTSPPVY